MSHIEASVAVPTFEDVAALQAGLEEKGHYASQTLYPRDGTDLLTRTEEHISMLARTEPENTLLYTSGMAAVVAAVEVALHHKGSENRVLACPAQLYSQTTEYLANYMSNRGIELVYFNAGSTTHVEQVLETKNPCVVIAETVGNEPTISVLDTEHMIDVAAATRSKPVVVLDNTLPLSTGLKLNEQLVEDDKVIVVESGTKSYTMNAELAGILHSQNPELLCVARALRRTSGTMPGIGSVERIQTLLPETVASFDERNQALYANTGKLALWLQQAEQEGAEFQTIHPQLPSHPNHEFAINKFPNGVSPVLYVRCGWDSDQFDFTEQLWRHPDVRKHADLGQSFGFDRARILPDQHFPVVRIAGGVHTNVDELGAALYEAAIGRS
jgi:cystathionine beta-lyase/cystathionine gamma-synthase